MKFAEILEASYNEVSQVSHQIKAICDKNFEETQIDDNCINFWKNRLWFTVFVYDTFLDSGLRDKLEYLTAIEIKNSEFGESFNFLNNENNNIDWVGVKEEFGLYINVGVCIAQNLEDTTYLDDFCKNLKLKPHLGEIKKLEDDSSCIVILEEKFKYIDYKELEKKLLHSISVIQDEAFIFADIFQKEFNGYFHLKPLD